MELEIATWVQQILGFAGCFLGSWLASTELYTTSRTYFRVKLFDEFEKTVPQEVKEDIKRVLEAEK